MTTSEPTTGEIVEVLRENGDVYFGETEITCEQIADRLESQEHEIVGLTELNKAEYVLYKSEIDAYRIASESLKLTILRYMDMTQTLTARAEQAEHRASDFEYAIRRGGISCATCGHNTSDDPENVIYAPCDHEHPCVGYDEQYKKWTLRNNLRGQPQDGEGK